MPFPNQDTQFKPGQSGNPKGSSRSRRLTRALVDLIEEQGAEREIAQKVLDGALAGDIAFIRHLFDRVDGKVPDQIQVSQDDERKPRIIPRRRSPDAGGDAVDRGTGGGDAPA